MIRRLKHINIFYLSKQEDSNINMFLTGFVLYVLGYMLSVTNTIDIVACQGLQISGLILVIPFAVLLCKSKFDNEYLKIVFIVFALWTAGIIARGIKMDYNSLKELFFDPIVGIMGYLVPLVLLFPRNISIYKKVFTVIVLFAVLYMLFVLIFFKDMRSYAAIDPVSQSLIENFATLGKTGEFLLMTYLFQKRKKKILAIVVSLITIYFAIVRARRGLLLTCGVTLTTCFLLYLSTTKQKVLAIILAVAMAAGAFVYMQSMSGNGMFTFLMARKDEDTRSNVEQSLIADMNRMESYVGRGINGMYYCPGVVNAINGTSYRTVIETGYLQIILKGGKIYLLLFLLILIPAVIKGLFYSKNIFAKGAALWILLWLFYLYPVIGTGFGLYYIIVWLCVGICYSKRILEMSDSQLKSVLLR
jgi:hypothetical protein